MSENPKVELLKNSLRNSIFEGEWAFGEKVPSIRNLADQFNVAPVTVSVALAEMRSEGLVESRQRKGMYVTYNPKAETDRPASKRYRIGLAHISFYKKYLNMPSAQNHPVVSLWTHAVQEYFGPENVIVKPLCYDRGHLEDPKGLISFAIENKEVDGLLITTPLTKQEAQFLRKNKIHFVSTSNLAPDDVTSVTHNSLFNFRKVFDHLYSLGHRRIVFVAYSADHVIHSGQIDSYVRIANAYGLKEFSTENIIVGNNDLPGEVVDYDEIVEKAMKLQPTAIIAADEVIANRFVTKCMRVGARIPENLSIACFSNLCSNTHVMRFTCIDLVEIIRDCIMMSSDYLRRLIDGEQLPVKKVEVAGQMILGESTARPGESHLHKDQNLQTRPSNSYVKGKQDVKA